MQVDDCKAGVYMRQCWTLRLGMRRIPLYSPSDGITVYTV